MTLALLVAVPSSYFARARQRSAAKRPGVTGTYVLKLRKGAGGTLPVKQLSPDKIEFDLDCNRGAPSYNMGAARGTVEFKDNVAVYQTSEFGGSCELKFEFKRSSVVVTQKGSDFECGYGHGVSSDGTYRLKSRKSPKFEERN